MVLNYRSGTICCFIKVRRRQVRPLHTMPSMDDLRPVMINLWENLMKTSKGNDLERKLNYKFRNSSLLRQALVHPSSGIVPDNQRMEFAGDALFGAALTLLLYREKPDWQEGALTKLRHILVNTETLHAWAMDLDLRLQLPKKGDPSHMKTAFRKPLADAIEALLAAIYFDAREAGEDGFSVVCRVVEERFLETVRNASTHEWEQHDAKTTLQERAAVLSLPAPAYALEGKKGPDHAPMFTVSVQVGEYQAVASARNIKLAQAEAARKVIALLPVSSKS